ncbi:hypothetical protein PMAYCL1PPCAC_27175, partial [Pristionchus mayeri]
GEVRKGETIDLLTDISDLDLLDGRREQTSNLLEYWVLWSIQLHFQSWRIALHRLLVPSLIQIRKVGEGTIFGEENFHFQTVLCICIGHQIEIRSIVLLLREFLHFVILGDLRGVVQTRAFFI